MQFDQFVKIVLRNATLRLPDAHVKYRARKKAVAPPAGFTIRRVRADDHDAIMNLLHESRFFRLDEIEIAEEVMNESIVKGIDGHYQTFVADEKGKAIGWLSFGATSCSLGTFDIYWIAVAPRRQRYGIGKALMQFAEAQIRERGGRLMVLETSGRSIYDATRKFYLRLGYREAAALKDFYAPGDDKVIFMKSLN